ncbi:MAG: DUF1629 domain-containing protein [Pseudomonadota bacterium]
MGFILLLVFLERTRRVAKADVVLSRQADVPATPSQAAPAVATSGSGTAHAPWVSKLFTELGLGQGYTPTNIPEDRKVMAAFGARIRLGKTPDPLPCLGTTKSTNSPPKAIKDIMVTNGGLLLVSDRLQSLLAEASAGASVFHPTVIYDASETKVLSTAHAYWVIGVAKDTLQADHSPGLKPVTKDQTSSAFGTFHPPLVLEDGQICLSPACLIGPQVWVEPHLRGAVFFDDAFVETLKRHKLDRLFALKRCEVGS